MEGQSQRDGAIGVRLRVGTTSNREFSKEYITQVNGEVLREYFPDTTEGDFLRIRNTNSLATEIHARVKLNEDLPSDTIGLDFTVRTALGAPSELEVKHGEASGANYVYVDPTENPEQRTHRRAMNKMLGVRPQVCRTRMGVFPDLEDKVCRLPPNTMQIIGVEEGENVTLESTRGSRIVRGVKAFEIDEEHRSTKEQQKKRDDNRYPPCEETLGLRRIRETEVDLPEVWIDEEVRTELGIEGLPKSGVCQPIRVYRDTWYLFQQKVREFAIPIVAVLFTAGFEISSRSGTFAIWGLAAIIWIAAVLIESKTRLN
ncbi:MAG: hypothetical protein ABEJ84_02315 [Halodesulfurarchaeum sp.]